MISEGLGLGARARARARRFSIVGVAIILRSCFCASDAMASSDHQVFTMLSNYKQQSLYCQLHCCLFTQVRYHELIESAR